MSRKAIQLVTEKMAPFSQKEQAPPFKDEGENENDGLEGLQAPSPFGK